MNLDRDLLGEWLDPLSNVWSEKWAALCRKYQERRQRKDLPDQHRVIFECVKCKKTVGSAGMYQGRLIFKIILLSSDTVLYGNDDIRRYGEDSTTGKETVRSKDVWCFTNGKCEKCGTIHQFAFEEMAQALGFVDGASALLPFLPEGKQLSDYSAEQRASTFIKVYLYRTDKRELLTDESSRPFSIQTSRTGK